MPTKPPLWAILVLRFLIWIANFWFILYHRWEIIGIENLPKHGPLIIMINHLSVMDIPILGTALIVHGFQPGVNLFTVSKKELWSKPIIKDLLPLIGMFPLDRSRVDMNAMRVMLQIFKNGHTLAISPEGTRSPTGNLQLFQPVVAKIAVSRHVPLLPIALIGTNKAMPIGASFPRPKKIIVRIGRVFELSDYYDQELTPELLERAAWDMREKIAELLPEDMRALPPTDAEARFGSVRAAEVARQDGAPDHS